MWAGLDSTDIYFGSVDLILELDFGVCILFSMGLLLDSEEKEFVWKPLGTRINVFYFMWEERTHLF